MTARKGFFDCKKRKQLPADKMTDEMAQENGRKREKKRIELLLY